MLQPFNRTGYKYYHVQLISTLQIGLECHNIYNYHFRYGNDADDDVVSVVIATLGLFVTDISLSLLLIPLTF